MSDNPNMGSGVFDSIFNNSEIDAEDVASLEEEAAEDEDISNETEEVEAEESSEAPKLYTVKAAGEEHELTLDDLISNAQKGIGFNRNSEKLAREHKAEMALLAEERKAVADEFERASMFLSILGETESGKEHMNTLMEYDLPEYKRVKAMQEEVKAVAAKAQADRATSEINAAVKLIEDTFPKEWASTETRQKLLDSGAKFFKGLGMTGEEIGNITNGAAYVAAIKAQKYDDLIAKAKNTKAPPTTKIAIKQQKPAAKAPTEFDAVAEFFPFLK